MAKDRNAHNFIPRPPHAKGRVTKASLEEITEASWKAILQAIFRRRPVKAFSFTSGVPISTPYDNSNPAELELIADQQRIA